MPHIFVACPRDYMCFSFDIYTNQRKIFYIDNNLQKYLISAESFWIFAETECNKFTLRNFFLKLQRILGRNPQALVKKFKSEKFLH